MMYDGAIAEIDKLIVYGQLPGDGWDPSAQRNGIILAQLYLQQQQRLQEMSSESYLIANEPLLPGGMLQFTTPEESDQTGCVAGWISEDDA